MTNAFLLFCVLNVSRMNPAGNLHFRSMSRYELRAVAQARKFSTDESIRREMGLLHSFCRKSFGVADLTWIEGAE